MTAINTGLSTRAGALLALLEPMHCARGGVPFYDTPVQLGTASGGGLSSLADRTDWQFEIKNNLKAVQVIQSAGSTSLLHKFLRERNRELSGEVTLEFQSPCALTALLANQQFSLNFLLGGDHQVLFT